MKFIITVLMIIYPALLIAAEPSVVIKDIRIDDRIVTPQTGQLDTTSGTAPENWTAVIIDIDVKIPDSEKINRFEKGKWLDSLTVDWRFLYKPPHLVNHINNHMRFYRSVKYRHIPEGESKISILIEPAVMKRYFDTGSDFKQNLLSKVRLKHDGTLMNVKYFNGEQETRDKFIAKAFLSVKSFLIEDVLKTRLETPFRSLQTEKFLTISKK